jgi:hypothetical protein
MEKVGLIDWWSGYFISSKIQSLILLLRSELKARQAQIVADTERLYRLDTWANFMRGSDSTDGLETIHGSIHVAFGGIAGHFGEVEVSGTSEGPPRDVTDL